MWRHRAEGAMGASVRVTASRLVGADAGSGGLEGVVGYALRGPCDGAVPLGGGDVGLNAGGVFSVGGVGGMLCETT